MKHFTSSLLILSFVGIAIFGFAIFDHVMHSSDSDCAASTINWTACPISLATMTLHHISALQAFLQVLIPSTFSVLLLTLLLAAILIFLLQKKLFYFQSTFVFCRCGRHVRYYGQQKIISWLARFEFSPTL